MVKWTPKSEDGLKEMAEHITKNFNVGWLSKSSQRLKYF